MIILAVEDDLSESVSRKLLREAGYEDTDVRCLAKRGFGHLRARLGDLISASKTFTVLLLVDLDRARCGPALLSSWLGKRRLPPTILFRVAVREIEAWLLADRDGFARFLGISKAKIERDTEAIVDPKRRLLELARRGKKAIQLGLLPEQGSEAAQGTEYNVLLCRFADEDWSSESAAPNNESLRRMMTALAESRDARR